MTAPHNAVLKAQVSKLGWMTATFVPTKKLLGAWERWLSQGPSQRPWLGVITSSSVWTSVIARCHLNRIGGSLLFFLTIVLRGSTGLCWGQLLSPPCTYFCGMPREVSCTCAPLFSSFATKASH